MDKLKLLNHTLKEIGPIADQVNVPIGFIVISEGEKFAVKFSLSQGIMIFDSVESAIDFIVKEGKKVVDELKRKHKI